MVNFLPRICPAYREATACSCGIAAGMFMHGTEIKVPAYSWLVVGEYPGISSCGLSVGTSDFVFHYLARLRGECTGRSFLTF